MIDSLAILLLGLEPSCYLQTNASEKTSIKLVLYLFSIVLILALVATYLIGFFVSSNHFYALLISILATFTIVSIFRFSLILIKPSIKIVAQLNDLIIKSTWKDRIVKMKVFITSLKSKLMKFKFDFNKSIPGFTIFFRLLYLSLLAFVIIFPLTVLTNYKDSFSYNESLRETAFSNYVRSETSQKNSVYQSTEQNTTKKIAWYRDKVNSEYFTMKLFIKASTYSSFKLITFLVFMLFFIPHLLLFRIMRNPNYVYVTSLNKHFESIIGSDYKRLKLEAEQLLKSKGHDVKAISLTFLEKNNPYKIETEAISERENISWKLWQTANSINQNTEKVV